MVITALRGGAGKTILTIGIIATLRQRGSDVAPFKKGPDYIDSSWLSLAAGRPCYNLDTFLIQKNQILQSVIAHAHNCDVAVIEGNRGLYDGIDMGGSTSVAELAKLLDAPVIFCIDCTKSTRTMAAALLGCLHFDPDVKIEGVVLNRVAGGRHESVLRRNIEHHCGLPVLGAIPKLRSQNFPERHMGLTPTFEHDHAGQSVAATARVVQQYIDVDAVLKIACEAPGLGTIAENRTLSRKVSPPQTQFQDSPPKDQQQTPPRIGIIRDSAFQFYYPENLEALATEGAELVFISPLTDTSLPDLDGLYLGGGFPETHVEALAANISFREAVKRLADKGLPIYAECGGLMFLGERLILEEKSYPMAGVLPVDFGFSKRPRGHGYTIIEVQGENPFFAIGTELRGHEFHYSYVTRWGGMMGTWFSK